MVNVNVKVKDSWWKAGGGRWKGVLKVKDPNLVGPDLRIPTRKRTCIPSQSDKQGWAGAGSRGPTGRRDVGLYKAVN